MANASAEIGSLWQASGGPFTVKDIGCGKKPPYPHGNTCWYVIGDAISRRNQVRREDTTTDRRPKQPGFQTENGLFTVGAQRQQFGVRVGRPCYTNVRSQSSKKYRDLSQISRRDQIVFLYSGCWQEAG